MKKTIIILLIIVFCVIISFIYAYTNYENSIKQIKNHNAEYEYYTEKIILGSDLSTLINKAINNNEKNGICKNEEGLYIEDEENSIKIDIKLIEAKSIFPMEKIYNLTIEEFMKYFNLSEFECKDIQYHETTRKVKYLLFEEITQSF